MSMKRISFTCFKKRSLKVKRGVQERYIAEARSLFLETKKNAFVKLPTQQQKKLKEKRLFKFSLALDEKSLTKKKKKCRTMKLYGPYCRHCERKILYYSYIYSKMISANSPQAVCLHKKKIRIIF